MKRREIMIAIVSLFVLVVLWVALGIYHNSITSTIPNALNLRIVGISNSFDMKTIDTLKKRTQIPPEYETASQSATPTPQPTPLPVPTAIPLATSSAQASEGGSLR